jgi:ATP-binding cassette subfamily B protein
MSRKKLDFRADAYRNVLGFTFRHWSGRLPLVGIICALVVVSTLAEVMVPVFSGQIVDAIAGGSNSAADAALRAFAIVVGLGLTSVVLRWFIFQAIIRLTIRMMADIVNNGFHRVQRFSTDWHANSFAGSTVRKITRGMWALDSLNDVLLIALLPSIVMLVGATVWSLVWARSSTSRSRWPCRWASCRQPPASPMRGTPGSAERWPTQ